MSNNEFEQQQFWDESYSRTIEQYFKDISQQEAEEWFSYTHDLIMNHLKPITNGK